MPTLIVSGSLMDLRGNGLPGKRIEIYVRISGGTYPETPITVTTDSTGSFSTSISVDYGVYDVKVRFPGDYNYYESVREITGIDARESTSVEITVTTR